MPQHMAPRVLLPSQCAHDSSRNVLFGLTDISKTQGIGCRKLSVFGLPVCRAVSIGLQGHISVNTRPSLLSKILSSDCLHDVPASARAAAADDPSSMRHQ